MSPSHVCPFGFFFDESVKNCWPCEAVCGGNGLNRHECSAKCQDYLREKLMTTSTTRVALLGAHENQVKLDIWLAPAIASTILALLSITIVSAIIWKIRKSNRDIPSIECEERSLMSVRICQESANSSFNTETTTLVLTQTPGSFSPLTIPRSDLLKSANSCLNFCHSHNSICLNEDRSPFSKPHPQICGDNFVDNCDLNSPISLKSDPSIPCLLNMADSDGGPNFPSGIQSSVVSSVHDMLHMFGWLNKTDWVMEYREDASGIHIGVEGIGKEKAEEVIRKKGHRLPDFQFVVTSPSKGQFIPCPYTGINTTPEIHVTSQILKPGIRIYSKEMEPDLDTGACQPGHAIYSGSLVIGGGNVVGLTVGHLFAQEKLELSLDNNTPIGNCVKKCESVMHHTLNKITADLALLEISLPMENRICFNGQNYRLKLFKSELSVKPPSHIPIIVLRCDGTFSRGQISNSMFTYKKCGLFNTLCIVDSDDNPSRISNEGDSGSLILSWPTPSSEYLSVYGMVIGYWINDEGTRSHTVATRLWNVLETLLSDDDFDFSNETQDSGFYTYQ